MTSSHLTSASSKNSYAAAVPTLGDSAATCSIIWQAALCLGSCLACEELSHGRARPCLWTSASLAPCSCRRRYGSPPARPLFVGVLSARRVSCETLCVNRYSSSSTGVDRDADVLWFATLRVTQNARQQRFSAVGCGRGEVLQRTPPTTLTRHGPHTVSTASQTAVAAERPTPQYHPINHR